MAELHTLVCRIRYYGNVTTSMCGGDKNVDKVAWDFLYDNSMEEKCTQSQSVAVKTLKSQSVISRRHYKYRK